MQLVSGPIIALILAGCGVGDSVLDEAGSFCSDRPRPCAEFRVTGGEYGDGYRETWHGCDFQEFGSLVEVPVQQGSAVDWAYLLSCDFEGGSVSWRLDHFEEIGQARLRVDTSGVLVNSDGTALPLGVSGFMRIHEGGRDIEAAGDADGYSVSGSLFLLE